MGWGAETGGGAGDSKRLSANPRGDVFIACPSTANYNSKLFLRYIILLARIQETGVGVVKEVGGNLHYFLSKHELNV